MYREQKRRLAALSEDAFFVAGLMLHLGEGDKRNGTRINLANTDPEVIKFFIKWLDNFLGIAHKEVKIQLHLYENMDIDTEVKFWKEELGLQDNQLYKTQIRRLQKSSFSYVGSYRHGTCSIFVPGVKRKTELMMATKALLDTCKDIKTMRA